MAPALTEGLQHTPAPSQFTRFKNTEPSTTASGVTPGRAIFDTPPPDRSPSPELARSQRTRRPSTKKRESSQSQVSHLSGSKSKPAKTAYSNGNHPNPGNTGHLGASESFADSRSQADDTIMANGDTGNDSEDGEDDDDYYVSQTIIDQLKAFVGHSVARLSNRRLKELLDALPQTQASALETQAEPPQAIAKPPSGVGLAGRDRSRSPLQEGNDNHPPSQAQSSASLAPSQKRPINTLNTPLTTLKRVRIAAAEQENDSATEDEDEDDSEINIRMRRRRHHLGLSESESDTEPTASQLKAPLANSQSATAPKQVNPKTVACPPSQSSGRPVPIPSRDAASSSVNSARTAPERRLNTTSNVANPPPPSNLNDVGAVVTWALRLVEGKARALDQGHPISKPTASTSRPNLPSTSATVDHVSRAIANHRSRLNGSGPSGTRENENRTLPSNQVGVPSRASTPAEDDDEPTGSNDKQASFRLAKLSDFSGRIGDVTSAAIPRFLSTVLAEGAYENPEVYRSWSHDAYRETWDLEALEDEYKPPPKAVLTIMMRRASWLQTKVRERVEVIVQYGFGFRNPAVHRADIKHNRRLAEKLAPHVFHCKELKPNTDQYEHPVFIRAIGATLFWDPESIGVVYHDKFNPIPIPAVALVLTMMQVCIEEWALGQFKSQALDVEKQQVVYEKHLLGLYEYKRIAGGRLTRFRGNWFKAGLANVDGDDDGTMKPYTQACHVWPDTLPPVPDDEESLGDGDHN
ncbi:hypothetical protein FRC08_016802 [Ceratobasidium sp. 394]|nr:hypothetical protein FRC08_016802 [Ceratobasidium sp. 394]